MTAPRIPEGITFKTKPQIALDQIRAALAAGVAPRCSADGWELRLYIALRSEVSALGLSYVADIVPSGPRCRPATNGAISRMVRFG